MRQVFHTLRDIGRSLDILDESEDIAWKLEPYKYAPVRIVREFRILGRLAEQNHVRAWFVGFLAPIFISTACVILITAGVAYGFLNPITALLWIMACVVLTVMCLYLMYCMIAHWCVCMHHRKLRSG